jgi:hypothetical protein
MPILTTTVLILGVVAWSACRLALRGELGPALSQAVRNPIGANVDAPNVTGTLFVFRCRIGAIILGLAWGGRVLKRLNEGAVVSALETWSTAPRASRAFGEGGRRRD